MHDDFRLFDTKQVHDAVCMVFGACAFGACAFGACAFGACAFGACAFSAVSSPVVLEAALRAMCGLQHDDPALFLATDVQDWLKSCGADPERVAKFRTVLLSGPHAQMIDPKDFD